MSVRHGMGKDEHDQEGRLITAEYPTLYVVNAYIPNSGEGLKRLDYRLQQWDVHFAEYLQQLAAKKPVVLIGDLNCCHQEIDIHAPKKNLRSPGFTQVCNAYPCLYMSCLYMIQGRLHVHISTYRGQTVFVGSSGTVGTRHPAKQSQTTHLAGCSKMYNCWQSSHARDAPEH